MKSRFAMALVFVWMGIESTGLQAQTSPWTIDTNHSSISFQVRQGGVRTVHGSIEGVKGTVMLDEKDITKSSVSATMETSTVFTGSEARDKDLKGPNFFDVANNPQLVFKSTAITKTGGKLKLIGDLTINGVTKSVTLDLDGPSAPVKNAREIMTSGFSATGVIQRKDFAFGTKSMASPMIGEEIKFTVDVEIDKK